MWYRFAMQCCGWVVGVLAVQKNILRSPVRLSSEAMIFFFINGRLLSSSWPSSPSSFNNLLIHAKVITTYFCCCLGISHICIRNSHLEEKERADSKQGDMMIKGPCGITTHCQCEHVLFHISCNLYLYIQSCMVVVKTEVSWKCLFCSMAVTTCQVMKGLNILMERVICLVRIWGVRDPFKVPHRSNGFALTCLWVEIWPKMWFLLVSWPWPCPVTFCTEKWVRL